MTIHTFRTEDSIGTVILRHSCKKKTENGSRNNFSSENLFEQVQIIATLALYMMHQNVLLANGNGTGFQKRFIKLHLAQIFENM